MMRGGNGYGQVFERADDPVSSPWKNILQGVLDSQNFLLLAADIPCDIIETLETDVDAAEQFVDQIKNGTVPTIIQDLPNEIIEAFKSLVQIALKLPTALLSAAESAVTEAVHIFDDIEDGKIVGDIESLPREIETDVTSLWGDVTSEVAAGWNDVTHGIACFFEDGCAKATTGACLSSTASSTPSYASATQTPDSYVSQAASSTNQTAQSSLYPNSTSTPEYSSAPQGPHFPVGYLTLASGLLVCSLAVLCFIG
ncbi:hypothetical protein LTR85_005378 [Meristemomyces frigidus]|nr:hypothetical protein LTR85_005378 [Meristemomyces frigidus]